MSFVRLFMLLCLGLVLAAGVGCRGDDDRIAGNGSAEPVIGQKEPYTVGAIAAITGPLAGTYSPMAEGLRIYVRSLNAKGGIDGHPVNLIMKDSQGNPAIAGSAAKELLESNKAEVLLMLGPSSNIQPVMEHAKNAGAPVLSFTGCLDSQAPPDPDPLLFCSAIFAGGIGSHLGAAVDVISKEAGPGGKVVVSALDIPASRGIGSFAVSSLQEKGLQAKLLVVPNPPPADLAPIAREAVDFGASWATGGAPEEATLALFEALVRLGWKGTWIGDPPTGYDDVLTRLKSSQFVGFFGAHPVAENKPFHQELVQAAKEFNSPFPATRLMYGWAAGVMVESAFKQCGWPCGREKAVATLNQLEVDYGRLGIWPEGAKLVYRPDDHVGPRYFRLYRWDAQAQRIVPAGPWLRIDHTGKREFSVIEVGNR